MAEMGHTLESHIWGPYWLLALTYETNFETINQFSYT